VVLKAQWSEESEKSVLGACLIDKEAVIRSSEILRPEMFYDGRHQAIYRTMLDMVNQGQPIDLTTVQAAIDRHDGGDWKRATYLAELAVFTPTVAHVEAYAREVREKYTRRQILKASATIAELADAPDVESALSQAEQTIFAVSQDAMKPIRYFGDVVGEVWEEVNAKREASAAGSATGFKRLDDALGGMQPADLIVLAARPSMGKSALAVQIAINVARAGSPALIFSLEMKDNAIGLRAISAEAGIDGQALRAHIMSEEQRDAGTKAASKLMGIPLWLDDTPALATLEMRAKARRLAAERGRLGLIAVDYLQLIGDRPQPGWSKNDHIGQITNRCKAMARELEAPVLLLSQLNRDVERSADKIPQLSSLRDSGEIEQTADIVLFIHRPERYKDSDQPGIAKIIIAKHRNGPVGKIDLQFEKSLAKFRPLARWQ
jgi:replicative DNA helicase